MNIRSLTPLQYTNELNHLIEEIRLKPIEGKEAAGAELKRVYMKHIEWSEAIFKNLLKMINSNDSNEKLGIQLVLLLSYGKLGGLIAVDHLSYVIQENETITFVNRFLSVIFQQFTFNNDVYILKKTAEVFGKLVRMGGTKIAQVVEADVEEALKWLKGDNVKEIRKLGAILALKQLLIEAPYLSFNKIFMNSESFVLIWNIVRQRNILLRETALDFLNVSIKNISQRELNMQTNWLSRIYAEIKKTRGSTDVDTIHGNIIVLRSLLSCALKDNLLADFDEICEYVLSYRTNKNAFIQLSVIETMPSLARFNSEVFCQKYLKLCLNFLLTYGVLAKGREKAIFYETLSNLILLLDNHHFADDMPTIMKTIMQELDKKAKPFCIEIIKCLDCLRIKFQKNIDKYAILTFLYELIILNGLYPQSLDFLSEICKLAKDDIWWSIEAEYIQLKLLMTISSTLTGKIYYFPHGSNLEESNLIKFQQSLVTELTSNPEFKKPEAIALSLQALATFDFSYHADSMALFVKEVVLENLDNELPVIRKAAANAGSLLYIRQTTTGDLTITKNLINEILEKFLSVCLSDPDNSVRETMLASLNENFDVFLNDQRYLKMLFTCLNDPIFKVQENALRIICRLVKYDPSEIVPYIKKKIFQSLNSLNYEFIHKEKDKIEILDLLSCIIEHAPTIISPHADTICLTIISMFNDPSTSNNLIPHVLSCLTQLSNVVKQQLLPYLRDLFPIIIQCMQDMSYTTKRENAIKTITHLIKNTGYVILPYYKYPNLLDTLLYLLKNETNIDIRTGLLRLMGGLGALDAFYYKKIQLRLADTQNTLSTDETLAQDFKSPFMINKRIKKAARTGNQPKHDLITFYNNILFIGDIDKKKTSTTLNLIDTRNLLDSQLKSEERAYNTRITQKTHVTPAQIEELLSSYTPINLSSPEYYTTVSIKALLKVLCDPTLNQLHSLAVDALNVISNTLKSWFSNFLHLVVPVFTHLIHTDPNLRELLMHHLEKIIKLCGLNFQEQFVGPILEYILTYISESQGRMMAKCFETLLTLIQTSKKYLRNKMELITAKLNHIISTYEDAKDIVRSVILIYSYLSEMLDNYLEHIISLLTRIIINNSLQDTDSLINIISFFNICITNCPNTVQYVSKIVQALIFLLDHNQALHPHIAKCFVNMIMRFKNAFLIYLPLINSCMTKYKIQHRVYKLCVEVLLNQGSWQELDFFIDSENLADPSDFLSSKIHSAARKSFSGDNYNTQPTFPIRATDNDLLLAEFNTAHKNLEEDWIEWMRKSSLELLRQNPYPVVYACHSVAELYPPIARELYNVAFVSCWSILNDKQKETMIKMLTNAINHPNTPVNILQTILNLAEFMQHDREVIPIDISVLGDLAERCLAYAKALYYRELEFEVSPESTIESLIALYTNLGHSEAANGLLVYAKNTLNIELKMSWYENLQRWDEALAAYNAKGSRPGQEYFVSRMRCLSAMSDWETLINDCDPTTTGDNVSEGDKKKQLIQLGANAALKLNRWDTLETYTENMETNGYEERSFFQAITALRKNKLEKSSAFIKKSREVLDSKVSGLLLESYSRAYDNVIKLQQLFEMEEIIDFQQERYKQLLQTDQLKECAPEKVQSVIEEICSTGRDQKVPYVKFLKDQLIEKWNDRLNGCQPSIGVWQEILSVRSILLSKYENLEAWIKFCKLCMKQGQIQICKRSLESVKEDVFKIIPDEEHMPSKLMLVSMECEYANGIKDSKVLIKKVCNYLEKQTGIDEIKSKYYLKLGHILKKEQEEISAESIKEILGFYEKSVEYNKSNYKAWHYIGLMNFEAVEYYKNINDRTQNQNLMKHVAASLEGLVNAIALGSTNVSVSKSFQDTLRLLTLWFDYGGDSKAAEIIKGSFMTLDIVAWIEVVPQLIARFDIPNPTIQDLIHTLLKYIGRHHPQALIYPLAVSLKEKMSARKTAAMKIFEDMKLKYPELIDQALIISEELCRTAILLKEQWSDGIEEACRQYFQERNAEAMLKTLTGLHELMKSKPQTLSEITFHQSYKAEINEAEAWLNRYIATRDEGSLNQAWDFYHSIFKKISEKSGDKDKLPSLTTIYLENVSPKLLNTKNTDVSVPGLYKPGKPLIKISGFAPKLQVLSSKQHPRKAVIYGSDGKEYTFLLKGHEDTRQDQRVMQLFSLVNRIMSAESTTKKKDLNITTYSVIPLSTRAGLIGWVQNSDPLQMLIREYRENFKIIPNTEMKLLTTMCTKYDLLCLANKVEIFRYVLDNTKGEDLKKVLWLKSPTSEIWLERRTNYTRSLATMSMVGYILGLGDRHPSNIMLQRITGKIVHIDFGDCFEVAMKREKFPEKIPFRLTRMLIKVMEACSIEGTYRATCEDVMRVLRNNKDSLMAVLQAFVYDPLVNWRLLTPSDAKQDGQHEAVGTYVRRSVNAVATSGARTAGANKAIVKEFEEMKEKSEDFTKRKEDSREREAQAQFLEDEQNRPIEIVNQRALEVVDRIKKKLTGRDFKEHEVLNVNDQVNQLIKQATSHENICQAYIGWCPFW